MTDHQRAAGHYQAAAEQGLVIAKVNLGCMHGTGRGVSKDMRRAFNLLKQSASQRCPDGVYNLAECYSHGLGVTQT